MVRDRPSGNDMGSSNSLDQSLSATGRFLSGAALEFDRRFSIERQNLIEPCRAIAPAVSVRDVHAPSCFMKAIRFSYRQRRAGVLRFNPFAILRCMNGK